MVSKVGISMPVFMSALILIGLLAALGFSLVLPQGSTAQVFGIGDNGKTVAVNDGSTFKIKLDENPSTGYSWNESVTPGLTITASDYISGANMPGAGGTHEWTVKAAGKGQQQFSGIYKRSWEPVTGNENKFVITVMVK